MSGALIIDRAGPAMTIQDLGRPGLLYMGVPRGGAADRLALCENAALLGQSPNCAVVEMAGYGGTFRATCDVAVALTGAIMRADIDGQPVKWNAAHQMHSGQILTIGSATQGVYGYLGVKGGFQTPVVLGSRAAQLTCQIGGLLQSGDTLEVVTFSSFNACKLDISARFGGAEVRYIAGPQTDLFSPETQKSFQETTFTRDAAANRQGVKFDSGGAQFATDGQLALLSDAITVGDIQLTGDGVPYVLMPECQTIGGYPRIGTVIPQDMPIVAQSVVGDKVRFRQITLKDAVASYESELDRTRSLSARVTPLVRDPAKMTDLLSYQLISGMVTGWEDA